jgi:hypothetical protein
MEAKQYSWSPARLPLAFAAIGASAVVLGSVLALFAGAGSPARRFVEAARPPPALVKPAIHLARLWPREPVR